MAKNKFSANPFSKVLAVIGLVCGLFLLTEFFRPHFFDPLRQVVPASYDPMIYMADASKQATGSALTYLSTSKATLIDQSTQLQLALQAQRIAYRKTAALEQENIRLREVLALFNTQQENYQPAEVIGLITSSKREYMINKGKTYGVYVGQVAVDAYGVVGQVTAVYQHSAKLLLVTDSSQSVSSRVLRTGMVAVLSGRAKGMLSMDYMPNTADVKLGDVLYSSGIGERFPGNYPVGVVHSISTHGKTEFSDISVKPFAKLDQPDVVLLLKQKKYNPIPTPAPAHAIASTPASASVLAPTQPTVPTATPVIVPATTLP